MNKKLQSEMLDNIRNLLLNYIEMLQDQATTNDEKYNVSRLITAEITLKEVIKDIYYKNN